MSGYQLHQVIDQEISKKRGFIIVKDAISEIAVEKIRS